MIARINGREKTKQDLQVCLGEAMLLLGGEVCLGQPLLRLGGLESLKNQALGSLRRGFLCLGTDLRLGADLHLGADLYLGTDLRLGGHSYA